jgi:IS30 family transposase
MLNNLNRLSEPEIDKLQVQFTNYLNEKYKEENVMVNEKIHRRDRLTKQEKTKIKGLHAEGYTYDQISELTGRSVGAIGRTLKKKRYYIPKSERVVPVENETIDWKAKYLKAVALLIENDLIEVEF